MADETKIVQVGDIHFQLATKKLLFAPKDDISGKEVCLILQMVLNVLSQNTEVSVDLDSFMEKHNLIQHFVEVSEPVINKQ